MLRVYEILENVDIQSEICFVRFDWESYERVVITRDQAAGREIRDIYVENDILYLEVWDDE